MELGLKQIKLNMKCLVKIPVKTLLSQKLKIKLTNIGEIKKHKNLRVFDKDLKKINLPHKLGHDHFWKK